MIVCSVYTAVSDCLQCLLAPCIDFDNRLVFGIEV